MNDTSLFCETILLREQVDSLIYASWKKDKATIDNWTERFGIATTPKEGCTDEDIKVSEALKEVARNFKTLALVPTADLYKRREMSPFDTEKLKGLDVLFLLN
jgi:hypothetical protein